VEYGGRRKVGYHYRNTEPSLLKKGGKVLFLITARHTFRAVITSNGEKGGKTRNGQLGSRCIGGGGAVDVVTRNLRKVFRNI